MGIHVKKTVFPAYFLHCPFILKKGIVKISKDQPNENKQKLFIQRCCSKEVSRHGLCFGRDPGEVRRERKRYRGKTGRLQACPDWGLLPWGSGRKTKQKGGFLGDDVIGQGCIFGFFYLVLS